MNVALTPVARQEAHGRKQTAESSRGDDVFHIHMSRCTCMFECVPLLLSSRLVFSLGSESTDSVWNKRLAFGLGSEFPSDDRINVLSPHRPKAAGE